MLQINFPIDIMNIPIKIPACNQPPILNVIEVVLILFARVLGMPADFWLGLQQDWDLWHAMNGPGAEEISRLKPISSTG